MQKLHPAPPSEGVGFWACLLAASCYNSIMRYLSVCSGIEAATVAFTSKDDGRDAAENVSPTVRSGQHDKSHANAGVPPAVQRGPAIRRLTPVECARLMGFPDDYLSQVRFRKKCPPADGHMYRSLGNSMAINCMSWLGQRIALVDELEKG